MQKSLIALTFFLLTAQPVWSATQTITLSIPDMNCPACPITVKKSLLKVDGVNKVSINFEKREATIVFDDTKTASEKLTKATEQAGYPSSVKQ